MRDMSYKERNIYDRGRVTDSIEEDRLLNLPYQKLSQKEEAEFIKKLKLSYYDDVSDDLKERYIDYYGEMFPSFKEEYDRALAEEKEEILNKAIKKAYEYRDMFLLNNQRLVYSIANRYRAFDNFEDLFEEGFTGMMRALELFDIEQGNKFSTYATRWIMQAMSRHIDDNTHTIRIPVHAREDIRKIDRVTREFEKEFGRKPTKEEIALQTNFSMEKIYRLSKAEYTTGVVSLETPLNDMEDRVLGDVVKSDEEPIDDVVTEEMMNDLFNEIMANANLDYREKRVLYLRFGFDNGVIYKFSDVADELGISSSMVGKIQKEAIIKLRRNKDLIKFNNGLPINLKKKTIIPPIVSTISEDEERFLLERISKTEDKEKVKTKRI